jgi:hypothetical protein
MPRSPLITTCFTGFFTAAAASLGGAHCAWAGTVTTSNETALVAYSGAAPTPYFSGSNPYVATGSIGTDFATSTLTVQASAPINGKVDVTFTYLSDFAGTQTVNGVQVAPADIFLSPGSSGQGRFGHRAQASSTAAPWRPAPTCNPASLGLTTRQPPR